MFLLLMEGSGSKSGSVQIMPDPDPGCPKTFGSIALLLLFLDRFSHAARVLGTGTYQSETGPHVSPAGDERERERDSMGTARAPAWLDYCAMMDDEIWLNATEHSLTGRAVRHPLLCSFHRKTSTDHAPPHASPLLQNADQGWSFSLWLLSEGGGGPVPNEVKRVFQ